MQNNKAKYGLIYYEDTYNIGDDILSYAAMRFLPHIDYYIDREAMDIFKPSQEDNIVYTIANGWFLHAGINWPPSPFLEPLFVGTHFSPLSILLKDYGYLDKSVDYFLEKAPVGGRDEATVDALLKRGIPAYFSGCLTLTLQPFPDVNSGTGKIIFTDVPDIIWEEAKKRLGENAVESVTHRIKKEEAGLPWGEVREGRVVNFLKKYQAAKLVITSRLHCALPCLALGTPVIMIKREDEDFHRRVDSYERYLLFKTQEEILESLSNGTFLLEKNRGEHLGLKAELESRCRRFIEECEQKGSYPVNKDKLSKHWFRQLIEMRNILLTDALMWAYKAVHDREEMQIAVEKSIKVIDKLENIVYNLQEENKKLKEKIKI